MRNPAVLAALISSFCLATAGAQPAKTPSAEEVLNRYVAVSGGAEAFQRVNTVVMKGTMEIKAQNIRAEMVLYRADGGKSYSMTNIPGMGVQEEGSNGDVAWEKTAMGPRIKTGVEKFLLTCAGEAMNEYARAAVGKDSCYSKVEFGGEALVEGKAAWRVLLTPKQGKVEEQFFDQASGLMVQQKLTMPSPLGELPITLLIGGYKKIDGLETPTSITTKLGPVEMQIQFSSVNFNEKIPDQIFALPPDIQALVNASKPRKAPAAKP